MTRHEKWPRPTTQKRGMPRARRRVLAVSLREIREELDELRIEVMNAYTKPHPLSKSVDKARREVSRLADLMAPDPATEPDDARALGEFA